MAKDNLLPPKHWSAATDFSIAVETLWVPNTLVNVVVVTLGWHLGHSSDTSRELFYSF